MDSVPRSSGVYKIVCVINNKFYVGSAKDFRQRWNHHRRELRAQRHLNVHLQNAWNKYGEEAFVFEIIELTMPWARVDREQYYLDTLKPWDHNIGFNISPNAYTPVRTPEVIEKLRIASTGKTMPLETRKKLSEINTGKHHTSETRAKLSAIRAGVKFSDETRSKMSEAKRGKKQSSEMIANRIASLHKMKRTPAHIAALTESRKKQFVIIAPDGTEYRIKGLTQFCKDHDLIRSKMSAVASGKNSQHRGWECQRIKE